MDVIKYSYSPYRNWFMVILLAGLILVCLYKIITNPPGDDRWEAMIIGILVFGVILTYLCRKFFFPLLRGETILELDKDKLQYFVSNKIVYWKDVLYLDSFPGKTSLSIRFALEEGVDVKISTQFIAGDDQVIYNTITEYFEKYKKG